MEYVSIRINVPEILNAWKSFLKSLNGFWYQITDRIAGFLMQYSRISGKIRHLARYGKNRRIRKKNCNKILREFIKFMKVR